MLLVCVGYFTTLRRFRADWQRTLSLCVKLRLTDTTDLPEHVSDKSVVLFGAHVTLLDRLPVGLYQDVGIIVRR